MSIIRVSHDTNHPYTMVSKATLEDENISWGAKGLWCYLISRPNDWFICATQLSNIFNEKGGKRDAIYSFLRELINHGYCQRQRCHRKSGQFEKYDYTIFESKQELKNKVPRTPQPYTAETTLLKTEVCSSTPAYACIEEQTTKKGPVVVVFSHEEKEKAKILEPYDLDDKLLKQFMKLGIQHLKDSTQAYDQYAQSQKKKGVPITNIPAALRKAIIEEWKPNKPSKEIQKELEKTDNLLLISKNFSEALDLRGKYYDLFTNTFNFTLQEYIITFKHAIGFSIIELKDKDCIKILNNYIKKHLND